MACNENAIVIDMGCKDTFCSGFLRIEPLTGGNFRFVSFAEHKVEGRVEHHVVSRSVWNIADLYVALALVQQVVGTIPMLADSETYRILM